jgi:DNA-binding CsgD family transcriptional regulator
MARRLSSPRLVGRAEELTQLDAALERARAGSPAAVLVAGEAGVGKTRLVTEFTTRGSVNGASVLAGGCVALVEGELAYAPVVEALRGLLQRLEPAAVTRLLAGGRGELARLLPELGDPDQRPAKQDIERELSRARLFGVLHRLLGRLASDAPVVLLVEDLHWADPSSLEFLAYLIRSLREERLLLVGTWRSDELPSGHLVRRWLAEQHRNNRVEALELARLSRAEQAEQLVGILGAPRPGLVDEVFARSGGNPFFAEELLAAAAGGTGAGLPERLREVLLLRVGDCGPAAQAVLRAAAAAGQRAGERLLAAVAPLGEAELLAGLREAVDRQLLVVQPDQDAYEFRHALVQEAVYAELLPGERTRLHAALAERLGSAEHGGPGLAAEVAVHWYRAHGLPNALAWSVRAAVDAERSYAFAEALGHYERALELWEEQVDDPAARAGMDHAGVLDRAARAAASLGKQRQGAVLSEAALREVDPLADPVRAGLLLGFRASCLAGIDAFEAAFSAYEQAMRLLPSDPPLIERADLLLDYANNLLITNADPHKVKAAGEEALAIARQLDAEQKVGRALTQVSAALLMLGESDEGIAAAREGCRIAEQHADVRIGDSYTYLGDLLIRAGRLEEAAAESLRGRELVRRLGLEEEFHYDFLSVNAAQALFPLGRWDEADQLARSALHGSIADQPFPGLAVAAVEVGRGEFTAAEHHLAEVRERSLHGRKDNGGLYQEVLAELRLWQGKPDDAHAAVERGLDLLTGTYEQACIGRMLCLGVRAQADRAERARARRDHQALADAERAATGLEARATALARNPVLPWVTSPWTTPAQAAVWAGERSRLQGRSDPAHWHAAAAGWLALGQPYPAAYAHWRQAEALLLRGKPAGRAAEHLQAAHATALRLGARPLLGEVTALARRARITLGQPVTPTAPAAPSQAERLGLTERELEVLAHVAAGLSNREIGEALFISGKTASVHISNILRKLQVTSRVQAATAAHRLGLVDQPPAGP